MKKKYIYLIIIIFLLLITVISLIVLRNKRRVTSKKELVKEFVTNQKCEQINNSIISVFYEDENYKYYYYCMKSYEYKIKYNGNNYSLNEAISNNLISIDNLNDMGLNYYILNKENDISINQEESIQNNNDKDSITINDNSSIEDNIINSDIAIDSTNDIKIVDKSSGECLQVIDYFYEDKNYKYYFNCYKSNNIYVIVGNEEYLLKEALKNNIITISDLERNGIKLNKEAKYQDR